MERLGSCSFACASGFHLADAAAISKRDGRLILRRTSATSFGNFSQFPLGFPTVLLIREVSPDLASRLLNWASGTEQRKPHGAVWQSNASAPLPRRGLTKPKVRPRFFLRSLKPTLLTGTSDRRFGVVLLSDTVRDRAYPIG